VGGRAHHDRTLVSTGEWREFPLFGNGRKHEANCARCPATARALERIEAATSLSVAGGGEAIFSVIRGGTKLRAHCGPTNLRLTCHLGIVVPEGCGIKCGDETREWDEGKCLIFDDSFEHQVWNQSAEDRIVLLLNFWHPQLSLEQRRIEMQSAFGYEVK